ncbi:MAG: hypothetical protein JXR37_27185 [Kiritimatiellae bacterium]|nr:hypothetical protein [Kiritimatiellia bacterium]
MHYVSLAGNHVAPYTNWVDAATNIQAAVDAAEAGDSVTVTDGVYAVSAPVTITTNVVLTGLNGADFTAVDGQGIVRCCEVSGGGIIDGCTFTNGSAAQGGGVSCLGGMLRNCRVVGNGSDEVGGGVYVNGGVVTNCTVDGNRAWGSDLGQGGGGIYIEAGSVEDCLIAFNTAQNGCGGGAAGNMYGGGGLLSGCVISNNMAGLDGGGGFCISATNCVFVKNDTSGNGGGALMAGLGCLVDCRIAENICGPCGGGLYMMANAVARDCTVERNSSGQHGGGIYLEAGSVEDCLIAFNTAQNGSGGGAAGNMYSGGGLLSGCVISNNMAGLDGGGGFCISATNCVFVKNDVIGNGGGVFMGGSGGGDPPCLVDCRIAENICGLCGGGLYMMSDGIARDCSVEWNTSSGSEWWQGGGGVYLDGGTVEDCLIAFNTAQNGSGGGAGGNTCGGEPPLNGCVISNNMARDGAGGCWISATNCVFVKNDASGNGGGVWMGAQGGGSDCLLDCQIIENSGVCGGGLYMELDGVVRDCTVEWNTSSGSDWWQGGGGVYLNGGTVEDCLIAFNGAQNCGGGAAANTYGGGPPLNGCVISNNMADLDGGGGCWISATNCVFVGNQAGANGGGGGAFLGGGGGGEPPYLLDCRIEGNSAGRGGGVQMFTVGIVRDCTVESNVSTGAGGEQGGGGFYLGEGTVENCLIAGNWAQNGCGGGVAGHPGSQSPLISTCVISNNWADQHGGGGSWISATNCLFVSNQGGASYGGGGVQVGGGWGGGLPCIADCRIISNSCGRGGGVEIMSGGIVRDCLLEGNVAIGSSIDQGGGGVYLDTGRVLNCLISGNSAANSDGGGVLGNAWWSGDAIVESCTIVGNAGGMEGNEGVWSAGGLSIAGCVVWSNTVFGVDPSNVWNSCVQDWSGGGSGILTNDPLFVDAGAGDYRLRLASPCIDAGANADWMQAACDLDGNPRVLNGTVDMGAYELPLRASVKTLLQGLYDTNSHAMSEQLGTNNVVPLGAPYADDARLAPGAPPGATDWLLMEVRDTNGQMAVSRSVWVNTNGYLLNDAGATNMLVDVGAGQSYSVVLKHRNHLAIMSAERLVFTNQLVSYDFTTNASCHSGGTNACVELEPGVWGMIAGDADGDGKITWVDRAIASNQVGRSGYWCGDADLSGTVEE